MEKGKHFLDEDNNINIEYKTEEKVGDKTMSRKKKKSKIKSFFKILCVIILFIVLIAIILGIAGYLYLRNGLLGEMKQVEINKDEIEVNEGVEEVLEGYRTIALFGVDSRSSQLEKGTRSDCIILAIIDQKTKAVKLVSVYRDTYLKISGRSLDKVNHAYAYGGASLSLSTLNSNLDLNITEFATVNFDSLVDIVDAVGGVSITIESAEVQYINDYIAANEEILGKKTNRITKAGTYNLDGLQALAYSRIRYTSGGDYKRTERMRTVLMAIVEKAKKMNVGQLNSLAKKILPEVYTNISPDEIISMLPQIATYSFSESMGWPYETSGKTIDGVFYGVPSTLEENVKKLHKEIYGQEDYNVSSTVKSISNSIINKAGR